MDFNNWPAQCRNLRFGLRGIGVTKLLIIPPFHLQFGQRNINQDSNEKSILFFCFSMLFGIAMNERLGLMFVSIPISFAKQ